MEQIRGVLKQAQVGVPVAGVIRKAAISEQTFYRWKAKYAGLEVDQVRQMAQLKEENQHLKLLVADLTLDKTMLQDALSKNGEAFGRGSIADHLERMYGAGERRACQVLSFAQATYRYRCCLDPQTDLRMRIREIAQARVGYGYRTIHVLLNREG